MFALKITINNGEPVVVGVEDWSLITASLTASRARHEKDEDDFEFRVGALVKQTVPGKHEHVRWPELQMSVGDKITIELIVAADVTPPIRRYRSDKSVQENPFTPEEIREMKRKQYLALKQEFEGESDA